MRTLIYALQSSGASLFTFFMGQKPDSIVIVDLHSSNLAPSLANVQKDIFLKCVITTKYTLDDHINSFNPDKLIFVVRNPYDNYASLNRKKWRYENGFINDKFVSLEKCFANRGRFDKMIRYEDFILDKNGTIELLKDFGVTENSYAFPRTLRVMRDYNRDNCDWCATNGGKYGRGKIHFRGPMINPKLVCKTISEEDRKLVETLCPSVCEFYRQGD